MASRSLAYRKLRRRGIPQFMGRASVLVQPRAEPRALWKSLSFAEHLVGGAHPVVLTQQGYAMVLGSRLPGSAGAGCRLENPAGHRERAHREAV